VLPLITVNKVLCETIIEIISQHCRPNLNLNKNYLATEIGTEIKIKVPKLN